MRRLLAWLVLNAYVCRPLFARLNRWALSGWSCPVRSDSQPPLGPELLLVGLIRTGSTSVAVALEALGLQTFQRNDLLFYLPEIVEDDLEPEEVSRHLGACGVQALALDMSLELAPKLVAAHPGVKVIQTVRNFSSWIGSLQMVGKTDAINDAVRLLDGALCDWLPYAVLWPDTGAGAGGGPAARSFFRPSLTTLLLHKCQFADRARKLTSKGWGKFEENVRYVASLAGNEEWFKQHVHNVGELVPPDQYLEFDVQRHSWEDLASLLGRPPPPGGAASFPWLRSGVGNMDLGLYLQLFPIRTCLFYVLQAASVFLNWLAFRATLGSRCQDVASSMLAAAVLLPLLCHCWFTVRSAQLELLVRTR